MKTLDEEADGLGELSFEAYDTYGDSLEWEKNPNLSLSRAEFEGRARMAVWGLLFVGVGALFIFLIFRSLPPQKAAGVFGLIIFGIIAIVCLFIGILGISAFFDGKRRYQLSRSVHKDDLKKVEKELRSGYIETKPEFASYIYITNNYIILKDEATIIRISDVCELTPQIIPIYSKHGLQFCYWKFSFRIKAKGLGEKEYTLFDDHVYRKRKGLGYDTNNHISQSNYIIDKLRGSGCKIITDGLEEGIKSTEGWFDMLTVYGFHSAHYFRT